MGSLIVRVKVLPSDAETNMDSMRIGIMESLPQGSYIRSYSEEPIAFGLNALLLDVSVAEQDGAVDMVEQAIATSNKVGSLQVLGVSRSSTTLEKT